MESEDLGKTVARKGLSAGASVVKGVYGLLSTGKPRFRMASPYVGNHDDSIRKDKLRMFIPTHMRSLTSTKGLRRPRLF